MTDTNIDIAATLAANGYEAAESSSTRQSDGTTARTFEARGFHVLCNADGSRRDYAPQLNLASITLEYAGWRGWPEAFSPVAARFADALTGLLAPTVLPPPPPKLFRKQSAPKPALHPLIRRTPTSLQLVYRTEGVAAELRDLTLHHRPVLFPNGLATSDQGAVLTLSAGLPSIPVGDDATWAEGRSPLSVTRMSLPLWDGEQISAAVHELVQRHVDAGDLRICGRFAEPPKPEGYYTPEAALARDGVRIVRAVDEHTGRSPGDLGRERGRWG
jgi:hypothetical protein